MTQAKAGGRPIKVVVTKVGLDGHDRGVKVIAQALREQPHDEPEQLRAGLELGPHRVVGHGEHLGVGERPGVGRSGLAVEESELAKEPTGLHDREQRLASVRGAVRDRDPAEARIGEARRPKAPLHRLVKERVISSLHLTSSPTPSLNAAATICGGRIRYATIAGVTADA